jgi:integrase
MASITTEANGRRTIQFVGADGKRHSFRIGKASDLQAKAAQAAVEQLVAGGALDADSRRWVADLSDVLHERLARLGLVASRGAFTLGEWLERYLQQRTDLKSKSRAALESTKDKLLAYFKADRLLRTITTTDAEDWRADLIKSGLSVASVKHHCGNAKGFFSEDGKPRLAWLGNPFERLASGATAAENERYITAGEAARIVEHLPSAQWKLLFGLARFGGLRTPSEPLALKWGHVDWERGRLTVPSCKTERFKGHEQRTIPIDPRLRLLLEAVFDEAVLDGASEDDKPLITVGWGGWVGKKMRAAVNTAKVPTWKRFWQALRSSCEKEWATVHPQWVVSRWLGHSIAVSGRHYTTGEIPDELYAKAAKRAAISDTAQGGAKCGAAQDGQGGRTRKERKSECEDGTKNEDLRSGQTVAAGCEIGATGFEPATSWSRTKRSKPG